MDKQQAKHIIQKTFENPFDKGRFVGFVKNLLNSFDETKAFHARGYVKEEFKKTESIVKTYERIGTFTDFEGNKIDLLIVYLEKNNSIEIARTTLRNFVASYLKKRGEKDAALVAFVSPDKEDWRFSLVKMDYKFEQTKTGRIKVKEEFTPARRWSFLVGKNENSHTAQSRLVNILANDEHSPTIAELEQAFDIETVTKEFFIKYRELFIRTKEELDMVVKTNSKIRADFEAKDVNTVDFAKKLLGQIVFLYFLQKKGWFGVGRDAEWGTGSKHFLRELFKKKHSDYKNFFNDILEPLFYEALRIDRSHDDDYYSRFNCKIPFLNGGLFDPIGSYDWVHTDILLPDELFSNNIKTKEDIGTGILDVFDRYNFTVKEDEPLEKEVAIDPELLGKAYEKFNAIRPDNFEEYKKALKSGNKGEESKFNKQYGVYYTPREIVHYMCQQSLINYLFTECNTPYPLMGEGKGEGVILNDVKNLIISKEDIEALIHTGEQVSENEEIALIKEQKILEGKQKSSDYKLMLPESIRKNAILIDQKLADITVCDPAVGSGAFPVGMMSEIVKARNVLTTFLSPSPNPSHQGRGNYNESPLPLRERDRVRGERAFYNFKRQCIEHSLYGVDIDSGAVEIAKLRLWLSLVVDEDDIKNIKPLPNLDYKIVCGNSLLGVKRDLLNDSLFQDLEKLKPLYFNETNPTKKQEYKNQIDDLIIKITNGHKEFDFEVHFSEVFHHKGGFDVVIANPPYVSVKSISSDDKVILSKEFDTGQGRFNLFTLFLEKGHKLLSLNGILTFIIPEGIYSHVEYRHTRNYLLNNTAIILINLFSNKVFEAAVDTTILSIKNRKDNQGKFCVYRDLSNKVFELNQKLFQEYPFNLFAVNLTSQAFNIIDRFIKNKSFDILENVLEIQQGIIYSGQPKNKVFANFPKDKTFKKVLDGRDILKWRINWDNKIDNKYISYTAKLHRPREERLFIGKEKILLPRKSTKISCAYDTEQYYALNTAYICLLTNNDYHLKFILSLLNSKFINFFYSSLFLGWQITIPALNALPIKKLENDQQQPFITLVDQILAAKKKDPNADTSALERQIDKMVYELYGLTPEEIEIVEGKK